MTTGFTEFKQLSFLFSWGELVTEHGTHFFDFIALNARDNNHNIHIHCTALHDNR